MQGLFDQQMLGGENSQVEADSGEATERPEQQSEQKNPLALGRHQSRHQREQAQFEGNNSVTPALPEFLSRSRCFHS